jgi:hypothetical protein
VSEWVCEKARGSVTCTPAPARPLFQVDLPGLEHQKQSSGSESAPCDGTDNLVSAEKKIIANPDAVGEQRFYQYANTDNEQGCTQGHLVHIYCDPLMAAIQILPAIVGFAVNVRHGCILYSFFFDGSRDDPSE